MDDRRNCQTSTAISAEPGDLSLRLDGMLFGHLPDLQYSFQSARDLFLEGSMRNIDPKFERMPQERFAAAGPWIRMLRISDCLEFSAAC
jgi:hypothetical protein